MCDTSEKICIGFIGLGLIGGSIAKTLRKVHPEYKLMAYCRTKATIEEAIQEGVIDIALEERDDRFADYDEVESLLFAKAREEGMSILAEDYLGEVIPSRAFAEGGIHEAIMDYENNVFFEILAEDLARRDMDDVPIDESNYDELTRRIDAYIDEFERNGTDNIVVESEP